MASGSLTMPDLFCTTNGTYTADVTYDIILLTTIKYRQASMHTEFRLFFE